MFGCGRPTNLHSSRSLTRVWYGRYLTESVLTLMFLRKKPRAWFAFFVSIPREVVWDIYATVLASKTPCKCMSQCVGLKCFFSVSRKTWHLAVLNSNQLPTTPTFVTDLGHFERVTDSFGHLISVSIQLYIAVPSTNRRTEEVMLCGRSFI